MEISRQRCALVDNITVKTYIDFDLLLCPRGSFTETQKRDSDGTTQEPKARSACVKVAEIEQRNRAM